ncbi:hypothetical protein Glove_420g73 [Diversispora epigaea]|uniref:Uncharacterized protein n=1 Tax=Diversispora epigaea TaxID=1348612 RepID=A0A397GXQ1_9GLOM|nr:hypothetical protein Glove_420g73 [Diversispora epigaea]
MTKPLVFVTDADFVADLAIGQIYIITYQIHLWTRAFTSKIFTAGIQITFCIEGLNNIIKHELQANSTLCNLAKSFFEYHTLSSCMGIMSVGNDLFPEINKIMSKYLTPHILSAERLEMAQCLYFTANKVELDIVEII